MNCVDFFVEGSVESAKQLQKQVSMDELVSKEKDLMDTPIQEEAAAEACCTIILPVRLEFLGAL